MPQPKGVSGNPAGRPKGTPNKATTELKQTVLAFIENNAKTLQETFDLLEPKDKMTFFDKMLKYVLPTQQSTAHQFENLTEAQLDQIIDELKNSIQDDNEESDESSED